MVYYCTQMNVSRFVCLVLFNLDMGSIHGYNRRLLSRAASL